MTHPGRLSVPLDQLKPHYDVVVVGSGYGGAVIAARLAQQQRSVCVLERGRELRPGDYPDTLARALQDFQVDMPNRQLFSPTALYDLRINPEMSVFLGCGLGGTSLINANVALKPADALFAREPWPTAIQGEATSGALQQWFARAQHELQPRTLPEGYKPLKLKTLEQIGQAYGVKTRRAQVTVAFRDPHEAGAASTPPCTICGDCVSGCNYGAKRTLLTTYLPAAQRAGAQIFTEVKVRLVQARAVGKDDRRRWVVHFDQLGSGRDRFTSTPLFVTAHTVVLAAGVLGSSEILMRSQTRSLVFSEMLGQWFSGNGDMLAFSYNNRERVNGIGFGPRPAEGANLPGPCISGYLELPSGSSKILLEDGVIPGALSPILALGFMLIQVSGGAVAPSTSRGFSLWRLLDDSLRGGVNSTQIFLAMVDDRGHGELIRQDDRIRVRWPGAHSGRPYREFESLVRKNADKLGGSYVPSPFGPVTVHPLGGCVMGEGPEAGVVDDIGAVFDPRTRGRVHPGLYVCDGSIIPVSLLANPLLTITAFAERAASRIA
jgi:cholesterol oxidase